MRWDAISRACGMKNLRGIRNRSYIEVTPVSSYVTGCRRTIGVVAKALNGRAAPKSCLHQVWMFPLQSRVARNREFRLAGIRDAWVPVSKRRLFMFDTSLSVCDSISTWYWIQTRRMRIRQNHIKCTMRTNNSGFQNWFNFEENRFAWAHFYKDLILIKVPYFNKFKFEKAVDFTFYRELNFNRNFILEREKRCLTHVRMNAMWDSDQVLTSWTANVSDSGKYREQISLSINELLLFSYRYGISVCWEKNLDIIARH